MCVLMLQGGFEWGGVDSDVFEKTGLSRSKEEDPLVPTEDSHLDYGD